MGRKTTIRVYSHGISVRPVDGRDKFALTEFCKLTAQYDWVKKPPAWKAKKVIVRVFAGATKDRRDFRFHRNQLDELLRHLDAHGFGKRSIKIEYLEPPALKPVVFGMKLHKPYDYQVPIIDFLSRDDISTKITNLQTGKGKTASALSAIEKIGLRTLLQLRGGYVDRWMEDVLPALKPKPDEFLIIRGSAALMAAIEMAKANALSPNLKMIVITNKTVFALIKEYELNGKRNIYGIEPQELYSLLQVNAVVIDEAHEDIHLNYRASIYRNIQHEIFLSATLETEDRFRRMIYDILFPMDNWAPSPEYDAYIEVRAIRYRLKYPDSYVVTRKGKEMYSHSAFEDCVLRVKDAFPNYLSMIKFLLGEQYFADHEWGQKAIIFFSLTDFCDKVTDELRKDYPEFKINTFISGTPESVLQDSDIIVTTIESCGTAKDIPGLKYGLLTRAVSKLEANEQIKGRLRKLKKWPDISPRFDYLVCDDIAKQVEYHKAKEKQFKGKVLTHIERCVPHIV